MDTDKVLEALNAIDWVKTSQLVASIVAAIVLAAIVIKLVRNRRPLGEIRKKIKPSRLDRVLTFAGAAMASAMAAYTMWLVLGDGPMPAWLKPGVVTFLEINLVSAALRSRQFRLLHAQTVEDLLNANKDAEIPARGRDIDGIAVWLIASGSASLGLYESKTAVEALARVFAPLIAAFSWERLLVGELRQFATRKVSAIRWINPIEALAVRLGLGTPTATAQTVDVADRNRRLTLVIDAGYRAGITSGLPLGLAKIADARANARYQRHLRGMQRRFGLGPALLAEVQQGVAALRQARAAVDDSRLAKFDPWGDPDADRRAAEAARAELEQVRAASAQDNHTLTAELTAMRTELEQVRAASDRAVRAAEARTEQARADASAARTAAQLAEARANDVRSDRSGSEQTLKNLLEDARAELARERAAHRRELEKLASAAPGAAPRPRTAQPDRRPPSISPVSPAPAGAGSTRPNPFDTYADAIALVQAGIPDWRTREKPISQGEVATHTGIDGVPTQRRIKYLIESMADRDPAGAIEWLVVNRVLSEEHVSQPVPAREATHQ